MIFLHKLIPLLISPLGLVFILALLGWVVRSRLLIASAFLVLFVASNPLVAEYTTYLLEKDNPPREISTLPESDALVVLGGMVIIVQKPDGTLTYEFQGAVDRFLAAVEAVREKKVRLLVFTRGQFPWSKGLPEGEVLKERAIALGVPADMIRLTGPVENTEDEAKAVRVLLGSASKRIVLVTSAFHMPRAARLFRAQGFDVVKLPVDFQWEANAFTPMDMLPSASALDATTLFEREMIGRLYYAIKYGDTAAD